MNPVEQIAAAVLYEGYVLWPYRRSATKNQQRWTLGGVYPRAFSEAGGDSDPWLQQTECLVTGDAPTVDVRVRFLHVVQRRVGRREQTGGLEWVDELRVGPERYLAWEEVAERETLIEGVRLADLRTPRRVELRIPAGREEEPLAAPDGAPVGALVRSWQALEGAVEVGAEPLGEGLYRLSVRITNTTPWTGDNRGSAIERTFVSTHAILRARGGEFVSLMDPPEELKSAAEACENVKTWPVLAGEEGDRHTMLSSPMILYDYPRIAPESRGDLFDGGEIDQLLLLNILTLTDEEKAEMRDSDPRTREILERSEAMSSATDFMSLHGAIRDFQVLEGGEELNPRFSEVERPVPTSVVVDGVPLTKGSRVRLRPRAGRDVFDIVLAGKVAIVEGIEQDYEDVVHLAVVIEDDPGRDLGELRMPGHRFFYGVDEVEPLDAARWGTS